MRTVLSVKDWKAIIGLNELTESFRGSISVCQMERIVLSRGPEARVVKVQTLWLWGSRYG